MKYAREHHKGSVRLRSSLYGQCAIELALDCSICHVCAEVEFSLRDRKWQVGYRKWQVGSLEPLRDCCHNH